VHRLDPVSGRASSIELGDLVGFAIPRASSGLVVGLRRSVVLLDPDGNRHTLATPEPDLPDNRFNDAKCDPAGRLWAGTMAMGEAQPDGALYRIDGDGTTERVVSGLTISNGLDWSPDASLMYLNDTPTRRVDVFDHDPATGTITGRRPFALIEEGFPDGLTVPRCLGTSEPTKCSSVSLTSVRFSLELLPLSKTRVRSLRPPARVRQ